MTTSVKTVNSGNNFDINKFLEENMKKSSDKSNTTINSVFNSEDKNAKKNISDITKKINTLDDTLEFINNTLNEKAESDIAQSNTRNALLLELITIMDSKDEGKLQKFFKDVPVSMGVSLLTQYLIYKLGLS